MADRWSQVALLLALSSLLFFAGLGSLGLTDRDEGSNAEAAREMVETGDWITPTLNYEPRFAKPVFLYWVTALTYRLAGVSEFTARLPSALSGVLLILLQYWFVGKVRGTTVAFLSALMLVLNVEVVAVGRLVLTDGLLMLFTTLAVYGFWLGLHAQRRFYWLFYVGMALGTLTKGPVGFLIPLFAVVPYLFVTARWQEFWRRGYPFAGTALFVLLVAPWYAAMLSIHGARYTTSVQGDTVGRFFSVIGGHSGTILFYIPVLLFGFFPWSGFLPAAVYRVYREWRERPGEAADSLELLAALWLLTGLVFFSFSATRLPHYIAPLFPAAAILTASFWHRALTDAEAAAARTSLWVVVGTGVLLGLALALLPWLYSTFIDQIAKEFPMAAQVDPGRWPFVAGVLLLLGLPLVAYYSVMDRPAVAFWISGGLIGLVLLIGIQLVIPRFSRFFIEPPQQLAYVAGVNLAPSDHLIVYGRPKPSLVFYARRKVIVVKPGEEEQMRPYLSSPQHRAMIVLQSRQRAQLPPEAAGYLPILERYGYSLLASKPMVEIPAGPLPPSGGRTPGH